MHQTLSAYEVMAAKVGRFDRSLEALHIDAKGAVTAKTTSIKELLLSTEMHVRSFHTPVHMMRNGD